MVIVQVTGVVMEALCVEGCGHAGGGGVSDGIAGFNDAVDGDGE